MDAAQVQFLELVQPAENMGTDVMALRLLQFSETIEEAVHLPIQNQACHSGFMQFRF